MIERKVTDIDSLFFILGSLTPDTHCRRLVPKDVWEILRSYFPNCPEFKRDEPVCAKCVVSVKYFDNPFLLMQNILSVFKN